jgi:hypothetical protein
LRAQALHRTLAPVVIALLLVAGACSDDGSESSDSPADSPTESLPPELFDQSGNTGSGAPARTELSCGLLTADDIGTAYEIESGPALVELSPTDECRTVVVSDTGGYVSVSLYTEAEAIALGPTLYDGSEPVEGVGTEAWYVDSLGLAQARLADGRVVSIQDVAGEAGQAVTLRWLGSAVGRA